jgi:uncharacterized protein YbbC (DUF1343 family)
MTLKTRPRAASWAAALLIIATLPATAQAPVQLGVDRFATQPPAWAVGKRLGVLTNDGALDGAGTPVADRLSQAKTLKVTSFFAPEHGLAADKQGTIGDEARNGIPIYSLYGTRKAPTSEQFAGIDILVCDLPDVGARFYTFASSMSLSMQAAKQAGKRFVVLDRPNPINGEQIEGPVLQPAHFSFVGLHPIPIRHGMTMGEMARMFNTAYGIGCDLEVVTMTGWRRTMWHDQTGLPWGRPSPAMKSLASAVVYPGMCIFEATNLACRVGDTAFTTVAAPWLDAAAVAQALNSRHLTGVTFQATKWPQGNGLTMTVTDRKGFRPVQTAWHILAAVRARHGAQLTIEPKGFDRLTGNSMVRERLLAGQPVARFGDAADQKSIADFTAKRQAFLLYP